MPAFRGRPSMSRKLRAHAAGWPALVGGHEERRPSLAREDMMVEPEVDEDLLELPIAMHRADELFRGQHLHDSRPKRRASCWVANDAAARAAPAAGGRVPIAGTRRRQLRVNPRAQHPVRAPGRRRRRGRVSQPAERMLDDSRSAGRSAADVAIPSTSQAAATVIANGRAARLCICPSAQLDGYMGPGVGWGGGWVGVECWLVVRAWWVAVDTGSWFVVRGGSGFR